MKSGTLSMPSDSEELALPLFGALYGFVELHMTFPVRGRPSGLEMVIKPCTGRKVVLVSCHPAREDLLNDFLRCFLTLVEWRIVVFDV